jgi:hypothetical protein
MKRLLLAGIAALSVLYASAASAQSAKIPAKYRGAWCWSTYHGHQDDHAHRCRKAELDDHGVSAFGASRVIGRNYVKVAEAETDCSVVAVKRIAKGHRLYMACTDGPIEIDLQLDSRTGQLTWTERNEEELAAQLERQEFHVTYEFHTCDLKSTTFNCTNIGFRDREACLLERKWIMVKLATGLIVGPCQETK